jgi:tRNA(Ile2)-agmatinylcytidine synthase
MCTTFLCYRAVKHLLAGGDTSLFDYPHLIRLNPNIPWKTRGNAALSLQLETNLDRREVFSFFKRLISKYATSDRANSGLVVYEGISIPQEIEQFSRRALYSVMSLREAREIARKNNIETFELRRGQGLVGALASIGNLLRGDHTFELIAYRKNIAMKRKIDLDKIVAMSEKRFPDSFSNYDEEHNRVMILPHGPDPVLCGIRGETPDSVLRAFSDLLPVDNLAGYMIFRTNQATGEHLPQKIDLDAATPYTSGTVIGSVLSNPTTEEGGHVFFTLGNKDGQITCASYEPTAEFRRAVQALAEGDLVEVAGGIRKPTSLHPKVLNLELIRPLRLRRVVIYSNPKCPNCEMSLKSKGKNQGFECDRCSYKANGVIKSRKIIKRKVTCDLYIPPVKAHRHLTKPLHRYSTPPKTYKVPARFVEDWIA